MEITIKSKNVDLTPALRNYAEKKVAKIEKFFGKSFIDAQVMLDIERGFHIVDVTIQVDGLLLKGEARTGDMYASIDEAVDKIARQIRKYKTKINRKLRQAGNEIVEAALREWSGTAGPEPAAGGVEDEEPRIVKTKRFAVKPMSVEEAMMQMELLGHDFFVFSNAETEQVNVIYRRKDGNYGLIEPEF